MEPSGQVTREAQRKQLLDMVNKIDQTCPQPLKPKITPLLEKIRAYQNNLDEIANKLVNSPLIADTPEDLIAKQAEVDKLLNEHKIIISFIERTLKEIMSILQPNG